MIAIIPLRGGSKRIPRKNIKEIAGKPLCKWIIDTAHASEVFEDIVISTDCMETYHMAEDWPVTRVVRPGLLSRDDSPTEGAMFHALDCVQKNMSNKAICLLQATSPLTTIEELQGAYEYYTKNYYDSIISAIHINKFIWHMNEPVNYKVNKRPFSTDMTGCYIETGNFYMTNLDTMMFTSSRCGGYVGFYEVHHDNMTEIDTPEDWDIIEKILKER